MWSAALAEDFVLSPNGRNQPLYQATCIVGITGGTDINMLLLKGI